MIHQSFLNYTTFPSLTLSLPLEGGGTQGEGETPQKRNYIISIFFLFLLFTFLLTPALTFATPQVPRTIVFQGILVDAGGNPLTDVPSANANISIVDGAGETRYEEQQNITIYQGATAFLVGMGTNPDTGEPTGGIPLDVMEPGEGDLILKIKIEGQTIAQEDVIFASVPFSFYSQYATELTQPIESKQIKDGAITVSHLSEEVTTYVKGLGVSKEELEDHKTEKAAHEATSISVRNTFNNLMGTDLQMLMESVDYNITLANKAKGQISAGSIGAEELDMSVFNGWDQNTNDDLTTSTVFGGTISGVYSNLQLADNSVNTNNIVDRAITASKLAENYLPTTGGTLTGDLVMENTDIVMSDNNTVDGVDVSELEKKIDNALDVNGDVETTSISQSIRPYAYGSVSGECDDWNYNAVLNNGYGVASVKLERRESYKGYRIVNFNTVRSDTNYTVSITPMSDDNNPNFYTIEKSTTGFKIGIYYLNNMSTHPNFSLNCNPFDFIVFVNE